MNAKSFCPEKPYKLLNQAKLLFTANWATISSAWVVVVFLLGCRFSEPHEVSAVEAVLHPTALPISAEGNDANKFILQASGWIEPDPFPIRVPCLYDGIVKEVYVLEGELVSVGQKLVSLVDEDAKISLHLAEQGVLTQKSKETEIESLIAIQRLSLEKAVQESLRSQAMLKDQRDYTARLELLPKGSISAYDLNQSRYKRDTAAFAAESALYNERIAKEQIELLSRKLLFQKQLTQIKEIEHTKAKLDFNRTEIFSPINGRILKLFAQPGKRLMQGMDTPDASTVVSLYPENKLQARIDVPLSEASKLFIGQEVEIACSMLPDTHFKGKLSRILGEADFQRNTLQVKVQILDPDLRLRPEMICRAKFFSQKKNRRGDIFTKTKSLGVFIPQSLQEDRASSQGKLWVIGKDGKRAEIRNVEFGEESINQYILVLKGLNAGDQIILNPPNELEPGDLVKISQKR